MSALALAALLVAAPLSASVEEPLVLVVHAPYAGASAAIDVEALVGTTRAALEPTLRVWVQRAPDTPELRRAGGDIGQLLRVLRPDLSDAGGRDPCGRPETSEGAPRLVWVLTALPGAGGVRVSSRLAEVYAAACGLRRAPDPQGVPEGELVLAQAATVVVADTGALTAYVTAMLTEVLVPALGRAGFGRGRGTLTVEHAQPGDVIRLDDHVLGAASGERVEVEQVTAGQHHVVLTRAGATVLDTSFIQVDDRPSVLDIHALAPPAPAPARAVARWTGAALVVAGGALIVSGALASDERYRCVDFATSAEPCPSAPWRTLGSGGPAWVPLGLAALGTGATWVAAPEVLETEASVPWRSLLAGVALGALTYGLSVALAPATPAAAP